jgi:enediyne biosynthesis protein E4
MDVDGDGDQDLYVGNAPMRLDGLPSPNRLFLNDGTGHFTWNPWSGLTRDLGSWCALPRDFDKDGDPDLVVCGTAGDVVTSSHIVIYRNDGAGNFTDVTARLGVKPIGEIDAEMAQLGGSGKLDLIQLSRRRIRVSIFRNGRYQVVWERSIRNGKSVAVGDVNGDGAKDIYLQTGSGRHNTPDMVLLNSRGGRTWTPISVPSTTKGWPDDVVALDVDGNGLSDFLVLNGFAGPGPVQLIAFKTTGGAGHARGASAR